LSCITKGYLPEEWNFITTIGHQPFCSFKLPSFGVPLFVHLYVLDESTENKALEETTKELNEANAELELALNELEETTAACCKFGEDGCTWQTDG